MDRELLPPRAIDVAEYILEKKGSLSAMKLQKLLYYAQAWHLVWTELELFPEDFEAWANGPVIRSLYAQHRGEYRLSRGFFGGEPQRLTPEQREIVDKVLEFYGDRDPQWLSDLTHMEAPWQEARVGVADGERSENRIAKATMLEYYSSLK